MVVGCLFPFVGCRLLAPWLFGYLLLVVGRLIVVCGCCLLFGGGVWSFVVCRCVLLVVCFVLCVARGVCWLVLKVLFKRIVTCCSSCVVLRCLIVVVCLSLLVGCRLLVVVRWWLFVECWLFVVVVCCVLWSYG